MTMAELPPTDESPREHPERSLRRRIVLISDCVTVDANALWSVLTPIESRICFDRPGREWLVFAPFLSEVNPGLMVPRIAPIFWRIDDETIGVEIEGHHFAVKRAQTTDQRPPF